MQSINSNVVPGGFGVFVTNNAPTHSPEIAAAMSVHSLVDAQGNPVKISTIRASLVDLYAQAQRTIGLLFDFADDEKEANDREMVRRAIVQILSRDFNTLLDIERQTHKEN